MIACHFTSHVLENFVIFFSTVHSMQEVLSIGLKKRSLFLCYTLHARAVFVAFLSVFCQRFSYISSSTDNHGYSLTLIFWYTWCISTSYKLGQYLQPKFYQISKDCFVLPFMFYFHWHWWWLFSQNNQNCKCIKYTILLDKEVLLAHFILKYFKNSHIDKSINLK